MAKTTINTCGAESRPKREQRIARKLFRLFGAMESFFGVEKQELKKRCHIAIKKCRPK